VAPLETSYHRLIYQAGVAADDALERLLDLDGFLAEVGGGF
jgi:hypothetical protein